MRDARAAVGRVLGHDHAVVEPRGGQHHRQISTLLFGQVARIGHHPPHMGHVMGAVGRRHLLVQKGGEPPFPDGPVDRFVRG